jgi:hypothetical protein
MKYDGALYYDPGNDFFCVPFTYFAAAVVVVLALVHVLFISKMQTSKNKYYFN